MRGYKNQKIKIKVNIKGAKTNIEAVKGKVELKINGMGKIRNTAYVSNVSGGSVVFNFRIPYNFKVGMYSVVVTYSGGRYLLPNKVQTSFLKVL
ncbi:hypothetical protein PXD04_04005 [Methanosphaera sp. ISO3-F5]|uniref:hypothetical protein n=1 Tax=Methanosphaera sp. ISO3-F5 TaxID=1452353 RepID=UPI002B25E630|nr:hypothetical protein [Methanosphaera sp. ISO3-F5]WQH64955.1 hypothetical protein PXD04_04005 [Methanosphaera sp. ISO3-F5]